MEKTQQEDMEKTQQEDMEKTQQEDMEKTQPKDMEKTQPKDTKKAKKEDMKKTRPKDTKKTKKEDMKKTEPEDMETQVMETHQEDLKKTQQEDMETHQEDMETQQEDMETQQVMETQQKDMKKTLRLDRKSNKSLIRMFRDAACQQDRTILHSLKTYSRSRRVFMQHVFRRELFSDAEGDSNQWKWLFNSLNKNGPKDMALCMCLRHPDSSVRAAMLYDFFRVNAAHISLANPKYRSAFYQLYFSLQFSGHQSSSLVDNNLFNRRVLFKFFVYEGALWHASSISGPGIPLKDLKILVLHFVCSDSLSPLAALNAKMASVVGENRVLHLAMKQAVRELGTAPTFKLKFFPPLFALMPVEFCSRSFRLIIKSTLKEGVRNSYCLFFRLYLDYFHLKHRDLAYRDFKFALVKALRAGKEEFVSNLMCTPIRWSMLFGPMGLIPLYILLDILFEACEQHTLDPFPLLRAASPSSLHTLFVGELFRGVMVRMCSSQRWDDYLPLLDAWMTLETVTPCMDELIEVCERHILTVIPQGGGMTLSRLARLCVKKGHYHMAFLLAFVHQDWALLERMCEGDQYVSAVSSLECIQVAALNGAVSTVMALVHTYWAPANKPLWPSFLCSPDTKAALVSRCCQSDLQLWAVMFTYPDWDGILSLVNTFQSDHTLDSVIRKAAIDESWHVVRELMDRCPFTKTHLWLFTKASQHGAVELAQSLVHRFDLRISMKVDFRSLFKTTILATALMDSCFPDWSEEILRLCIEAGASAENRRMCLGHQHVDFCPLKYVLYEAQNASVFRSASAVESLLRSGAICNRSLDKLRRVYQKLSRLPQFNTSELLEWRECNKMVVRAAANPCRLENLARLAVSAAIGSRVGRPGRISSLGMSEPVENLLYFRDVGWDMKAKKPFIVPV
ncbi:hypothetical protein ACOMHN_032822 [Nucella lapillus]